MQTPRAFPLRLATLLGLALIPLAASGQIMLSPATVLGTDLGTFSEEAPLVNLINHSGLDNPFVSGTTDFATYFAAPHLTWATNGAAYNWQSDTVFSLPLQGYLDFDLGASHRVSQLAIWNITAQDITVAFAEDQAGLATAPVAGTFRLTNHSSYPGSYAVDVLTLDTPQPGRYLRLAIQSAYLLVPGVGFTYAILGEVVLSVAPTATPTVAIAQEPNGDVKVTFTGTLQSAPTANGTFVPVPGNPQGTYTVSRGNLAGQQYFRAQLP